MSAAPYLSAGATLVGGLTAKSRSSISISPTSADLGLSPQPRRAYALWGYRREPWAHGICNGDAPRVCRRIHVARAWQGAFAPVASLPPAAILYALLRRAAFSPQSLAG